MRDKKKENAIKDKAIVLPKPKYNLNNDLNIVTPYK